MINWVIFDAMGVVFTVGDDTNDLLVPFVQERNGSASRDVINKTYLRASLGEITSRQFWHEIGLGAYYPAIETEYLDTMLIIDNEFLPVARRMTGRYSLGLLSNDVSEWSGYLSTRFSLDFFDTVVISGNIHYRKPDLGIYELFLQEAKASAQECVFIDDRYKNLAPARELGLKTIHFAREPANGNFIPDATISSFAALESTLERICQQPHPVDRTGRDV